MVIIKYKMNMNNNMKKIIQKNYKKMKNMKMNNIDHDL